MLTSPLSHSDVCELLWFFGDYHIPQGEIKIRSVRVELKRRDTAVFDRLIVNTSIGAPLTDTACLDALGCVK